MAWWLTGMVLQLTDTGEPDESSVKRFSRADLLLSTIDPWLIFSHVSCVNFPKDCIDRESFGSVIRRVTTLLVAHRTWLPKTSNRHSLKNKGSRLRRIIFVSHHSSTIVVSKNLCRHRHEVLKRTTTTITIYHYFYHYFYSERSCHLSQKKAEKQDKRRKGNLSKRSGRAGVTLPLI